MVKGRTPPRRPLSPPAEHEQLEEPVAHGDELPEEEPEQAGEEQLEEEQPEQPPEPRYASGAATMMSQTRIGPQTRADLSEVMKNALIDAQAAGKSDEEQGAAVREAIARYNAGEDKPNG